MPPLPFREWTILVQMNPVFSFAFSVLPICRINHDHRGASWHRQLSIQEAKHFLPACQKFFLSGLAPTKNATVVAGL